MIRSATRLEFTPPLVPDNLFGHLAATAVPGVEEWRDGAYRRTLRLHHGPAIIEVRPPRDGSIELVAHVGDERDEAQARQEARFVLDLDTDPAAVDRVLGEDEALADLVARAPGRRVPHVPDGAEFAVRALLGQQVSTAAARTHAARLVVAHGEPLDDPGGGLTHLFPTPAALRSIDPATLALPHARRTAFLSLVAALADGTARIDRTRDPAAVRAELLALPGIGPWTAESVAMRALGDPDAFLATDLGVKVAARERGLPPSPSGLIRYAERWRPYRAYAVQHLWAVLPHAINRLPEG